MGRRSQPRANSYVWFRAALVAGALLAVVLIANSVLNYIYVSRLIVVDQVRRDMRTRVAALEREIRQAGGEASVETVLRRLPPANGTVSIEVRARDGKLLAKRGSGGHESFNDKFIESRRARREPVYAVRDTARGKAVVELFPVWFGAGNGGQIEMATLIDSVGTSFWPLQRNLIISCSAAVALLISLIVMRLRFNDYLRGRKLEAELEIAHEVQRSLLPREDVAPTGMSVASEFLPAAQVGGDLYDFFETERGAGLVIGGVSGKGLPAALLMGVIQGAIRAGDWRNSEEAHREASRRLNQFLCERAPDSQYATLFWASYDRHAGRLRYINAGHHPPLLIRSGRDGLEIRALDEGGPVLGLLTVVEYHPASIDLCPGDLLILYSDGLVEAANSAGEEFGAARLRKVLEETEGQSAVGVRNAILQSLREFAGTASLSDDLTLVAVRFDPVSESPRGEETFLAEERNLVVTRT